MEFGQFCLCLQLQYWYLSITIQARGFILYRFQLIFKYHVPVYKIMFSREHRAYTKTPACSPTNEWSKGNIEHIPKWLFHFFLCIYCKTNVGILKATSNARNTNQITNWILDAFKTDKRKKRTLIAHNRVLIIQLRMNELWQAHK
jgi:hypothetical protein